MATESSEFTESPITFSLKKTQPTNTKQEKTQHQQKTLATAGKTAPLKAFSKSSFSSQWMEGSRICPN